MAEPRVARRVGGAGGRCEVVDHSWAAPPRSPDCPLNWGDRFQLTRATPPASTATTISRRGADSRLRPDAVPGRAHLRQRVHGDDLHRQQHRSLLPCLARNLRTRLITPSFSRVGDAFLQFRQHLLEVETRRLLPLRELDERLQHLPDIGLCGGEYEDPVQHPVEIGV
jgi:hypothetical protein